MTHVGSQRHSEKNLYYLLTIHWYAFVHQSKDKFGALRGHESPEGEQKYSCTFSLSSAVDGRGLLKPRPGSFYPKKPGILAHENLWASGPV